MAKPDGLCWLLLGAALTSCFHAKQEVTPPSAPLAAQPDRSEAEDAPVFVGLEMRDHQLWLHMGSDRPLYTVKDKQGKVLAERIDEEQLKRDFPEIPWSQSPMIDVGYEDGGMRGLGYGD